MQLSTCSQPSTYPPSLVIACLPVGRRGAKQSPVPSSDKAISRLSITTPPAKSAGSKRELFGAFCLSNSHINKWLSNTYKTFTKKKNSITQVGVFQTANRIDNYLLLSTCGINRPKTGNKGCNRVHFKYSLFF
jgi:hypothetical protein